MVGVWDQSGTTIPLVLWYGLAETDGGNVDGQRRDQPRPPHEDTLAKVNHVLLGTRDHDAWPGRYRCPRNIRFTGFAL